jgi:hypothetical protein
MATISFVARRDSITANNDVLNPLNSNSFPAQTITFTDDLGGGQTGDLTFDYVPGGFDPDTRVIIDGQSYQFRVELTGVLPAGSGALTGRQIMLITVFVGGQERQYFFVLGEPPATAAQMNALGNDAIALTLVDFTPCFCAGTEIATPSGVRPVEDLMAGDLVLTAEGTARPILWIGSTRISHAALQANPSQRPIVIAANAFGPGAPDTDLHVSPQHRVLAEGPMCDLLFGEAAVLVPARFLVGRLAEVAVPTADVDYYHILLEDHDMLVSNGLVTESFQPARRIIDVLDAASRAQLEAQLAALGEERLLFRKDRYPSLRRREALVLLDRLTQPHLAMPTSARDQRPIT